MAAYYNEIDSYAAQWLRNLIGAGLIPHGDVDTRDIRDVHPADLRGYRQAHFFAGIGGWPLALRMAGWPDERPVWTGSCPCQPFSAAGRRKSFEDERHLWPEFFRLIAECRPNCIFGEQVASPDGYAWLDSVQTDLENAAYAVGAVVAPAAGFGAPHGRHRIYFVAYAAQQQQHRSRGVGAGWRAEPANSSSACTLADSNSRKRSGVAGSERRGPDWSSAGRIESDRKPEPSRLSRALADDDGGGREKLGSVWLRRTDVLDADRCGQARELGRPSSSIGGVADADDRQPEQSAGKRARPGQTEGRRPSGEPDRRGELAERAAGTGPTNGHWRDADWLFCRDGKWRPVGPGTFPLANGVPARVGKLRAYGNAIVAPQAAEFIKAAMECISEVDPP